MTPDYMTQTWYAHPNDTIGGWAVLNCDKPVSQADHREGEMVIANFVSASAARRIAALHNADLES